MASTVLHEERTRRGNDVVRFLEDVHAAATIVMVKVTVDLINFPFSSP